MLDGPNIWSGRDELDAINKTGRAGQISDLKFEDGAHRLDQMIALPPNRRLGEHH
jgi:hypothetical protein